MTIRTGISYRFQRLKRSLFARLMLGFPRLNGLLGTPTPLFKIDYPATPQRKTLIVFLPGIDDLAEDFEHRGIIDDMRRHGVDADAIAVDAHFGYYANQIILERITEDVIELARMDGYENIWLAGVSLGGFGAVLYAAHHASQLQGLILFAPFLGTERIIAEIQAAGGLAAWTPGEVGAGDYQRTLWAWLKAQTADEVSDGQAALPIFLGYGEQDKFAAANALLAAQLPAARVVAIPGGHNWRTWKLIWSRILQAWRA